DELPALAVPAVIRHAVLVPRERGATPSRELDEPARLEREGRRAEIQHVEVPWRVWERLVQDRELDVAADHDVLGGRHSLDAVAHCELVAAQRGRSDLLPAHALPRDRAP